MVQYFCDIPSLFLDVVVVVVVSFAFYFLVSFSFSFFFFYFIYFYFTPGILFFSFNFIKKIKNTQFFLYPYLIFRFVNVFVIV